MIRLTRINGSVIYVNPHQIETMESVPDTVLKMLSERKIIVEQNADEVIHRIVEYRKKIGILGNDTLS